MSGIGARSWFSAREPDPKPPPVEEVDDTIRAYKRASLVYVEEWKATPQQWHVMPRMSEALEAKRHERIKFQGTGHLESYDTEAFAVCGRQRQRDPGPGPHPDGVPSWSCSCGFYAYRDAKPGNVPLSGGVCEIEVELGGRILQFEHMWRAQYQRVLSVTLDVDCTRCCERATTVGALYGHHGVQPLCTAHLPARQWSLDELRTALGTEVRWAKYEPGEWAATQAVSLRPGDVVRLVGGQSDVIEHMTVESEPIEVPNFDTHRIFVPGPINVVLYMRNGVILQLDGEVRVRRQRR